MRAFTIFAAFWFSLTLGGCSATKAINRDAAEATQQATEGDTNLAAADSAMSDAQAEPDPEKKNELIAVARVLVDKARGAFKRINELAAGIVDRIRSGQVKDVEWSGWFYIKWAIVIGPTIFIVWRFWPLISVAIGWIPAVFKQRAKVAVDFVADPAPLEPQDVETVRNIEAAKKDPRFKAAFKAEATARGIVT